MSTNNRFTSSLNMRIIQMCPKNDELQRTFINCMSQYNVYDKKPLEEFVKNWINLLVVARGLENIRECIENDMRPAELYILNVIDDLRNSY